MSSRASRNVVLLALGANVGIAVAKLVAFALTASAAMLTESIHSLADRLSRAQSALVNFRIEAVQLPTRS